MRLSMAQISMSTDIEKNKEKTLAYCLQFQGQVMTYVPGEYPCYRCIFEEISEEGTVPNCSQAGVLGTVAGIIGSIQALEAKYIVGTGELLAGKMLVFDGLSMDIRIIRFGKKNETCRLCGSRKQIDNIKIIQRNM